MLWMGKADFRLAPTHTLAFLPFSPSFANSDFTFKMLFQALVLE
jgi:hypothetical protein